MSKTWICEWTSIATKTVLVDASTRAEAFQKLRDPNCTEAICDVITSFEARKLLVNPKAQPPALKALVESLQDALEGLQDMFPYVPEDFQKKWGHQGYIDRARAALTPFLDPAQPKQEGPNG